MRVTAILLVASAAAVALALAVMPGTADGPSGAAIYAATCASCHGDRGQGTVMGKPLDGDKVYGNTQAEVAAVIRDGIPETTMTGFKDTLTDDEIESVAAFVVSLATAHK